MAKQDFYELLGISKTADNAEIKKAFRKKAMEYHPDRNPGDTDAEHKFKAVNEAYDVLKDAEKRAAYDRFGHAAFENGGGPRGPGAGDFSGSFSDIFDEFFGDMMGRGGRRRDGSSRGADLRYNLEISLEDAFNGKDTEITIPSTVACDSCHGSGAEPGTQPDACTTCNGLGKVRSQQGFFVVERTCPSCAGAGQVISDPCHSCHGAGRLQKEKTLSVHIPAGVEDGTRIRLAGEGEAGLRGGTTGDLYIFLSIKPHRVFERDGTTIYCRVPLAMTTAALGGEVEVPTIAGTRARLKVPDGTQSGRQFRLRGKGMPQLNSSHVGDMIIETQVETPVNLSKKQKEILRKFAEEGGDQVSPESTGFFAKVRDLWDDLTD